MSKIEWTEKTWNPVVGCTPVSPGCLNCYAATMARRLEAMGKPEYQPRRIEPDGTDRIGHVAEVLKPGTKTVRIAEVKNGRAVFTGDVRTVPERLDAPLRWKKPSMIFVNSMSDLFWGTERDLKDARRRGVKEPKPVPFDFIDRVFAVMALCPQHTFQVLTKRPERMAEYLAHVDGSDDLGRPDITERRVNDAAMRMEDDRGRETAYFSWPLPNVWLGTSIESDEYHARAWKLLECPAAVRFLSLEPLIAPVDLDKWELLHKAWIEKRPTMVRYIDWVIVGGESGANARPCDVAWIRSIVGQCKAAGVPCFVKQLGAKPFVHRCGDCDPCAAHEPCPYYGPEERLNLSDPKGGEPAEWPADLQVREMPGGAGQ